MKMRITLDFHPGFQPPTVEGNYYCITQESGMIQTLPYSPIHNRFNIHDRDKTTKSAIKVRWWAPIPKSIKVPYGKGMRVLGTEVRP